MNDWPVVSPNSDATPPMETQLKFEENKKGIDAIQRNNSQEKMNPTCS